MNFLTKFNQLSGKMRLAVLISAIWFVVGFSLGWEKDGLVAGCYNGILPLLVVWGIWWVRQGFKKDKDE